MQRHSFRAAFVKISVFLFCAVIGFFIGSLFAKAFGQQPPTPKPGIFYKVSGKGLKEPSYLLGTYHLLKSGYIQQFQNINTAFESAKGVVIEVELDSASMAAMAGVGRLEKGTLSSLLDKPFADSLNSTLLQIVGAPLQAVDAFSPMNVLLTLTLVQTIKDNDSLMNAYNGEPMDQSFAIAGKKAGKSVTPLETIAQQMGFLFNTYSIEEQTSQLKDFVRHQEQGRKVSNDLVNAYLAHDLQAMERLYQTSLELSGQTDKLIKDRNEHWMKVLPQLINNQSQFIAVGALHLAGKHGLVALLKQQGYTVTPVALQ